jgi:hypothetical protein
MIARILAALLVGTVGLSSQTSNPAADRLITVGRFAFGGVGFAGVITQGEKDYEQVMAGPERKAVLERVFKRGSSEAKAYALTGMYQVDRERFAVLAASVAGSKATVHTAHGCILRDTTLGSIVERIKKGD